MSAVQQPPLPAVQQPALPALSKDEKKLIDKKRPFHILYSFFEVSEQPQQKKEDLYNSILAAFLSRVEHDADLSSLAKQHIVLGNKDVSLTGERLWDKAKEIKRAFVNDYLPHYPKVTPSGTTSEDELLDMCLKNFQFAKAKLKEAKEGRDPEALDFANFNHGKTPVDFWAFRMLHSHHKISPTTSATVDPEDPEKDLPKNRKRTVNRVQQKAIDRKKKRQENLNAAKALEMAPRFEFEEKMKLARMQIDINSQNMQMQREITYLKAQALKLKYMKTLAKLGAPGIEARLNNEVTALETAAFTAPVAPVVKKKKVETVTVPEVAVVDKSSTDDSGESSSEEEESPNKALSNKYDHHHRGNSTASSSDNEEQDDSADEADEAKGNGTRAVPLTIRD